jgi:hypothetical protein
MNASRIFVGQDGWDGIGDAGSVASKGVTRRRLALGISVTTVTVTTCR